MNTREVIMISDIRDTTEPLKSFTIFFKQSEKNISHKSYLVASVFQIRNQNQLLSKDEATNRAHHCD